jgi:hypothetical protein
MQRVRAGSAAASPFEGSRAHGTTETKSWPMVRSSAGPMAPSSPTAAHFWRSETTEHRSAQPRDLLDQLPEVGHHVASAVERRLGLRFGHHVPELIGPEGDAGRAIASA